MEDPFAGLDAFDEEPITSLRENRLRAAFEESKRSFTTTNELIVLQPGVRLFTFSCDLHTYITQ